MNNSEFPTVDPPEYVYRVARGADPVALRPWDTVTEETPANGRFDDSYGSFRTLYTAETRRAAYREALRDFHPSGDLLSAIRAIANEDPDDFGDDLTAGVGRVPLSWMTERCIGTIRVRRPAPCVEIAHSGALNALSMRSGRHVRLGDVLGDNRVLTKSIARLCWNAREHFHGIAYPSAEGVEHQNFAFFETEKNSGRLRADMLTIAAEPIRVDDDDFVTTANGFGLLIDGLLEANEASFLFPGIVPWHEQIRLLLREIDVTFKTTYTGCSFGVESAVAALPYASFLLFASASEVIVHVLELNEGYAKLRTIGRVSFASESMAQGVVDLLILEYAVLRDLHTGEARE